MRTYFSSIAALALSLLATAANAQSALAPSAASVPPTLTPVPVNSSATSDSAAQPDVASQASAAVVPSSASTTVQASTLAPALQSAPGRPAAPSQNATPPAPASAQIAAPPPAAAPTANKGAAPSDDTPSVPPIEENAPIAAILVRPKPSQGHFVALSAYGVGSLAYDRGRGWRGPSLGEGFGLRFGEALTDWLDLGLSFNMAFTQGDKEDRLRFGRLGIHSQWYLTDKWFAQLGFGVASAIGADPEDLKKTRSRYGDAYWTGIGTNLYISDSNSSGGWVLTPVASLEVGPDRRFTTTALWLGIEVSFWTGLTRDKLDLPVSEAYRGKRQK